MTHATNAMEFENKVKKPAIHKAMKVDGISAELLKSTRGFDMVEEVKVEAKHRIAHSR